MALDGNSYTLYHLFLEKVLTVRSGIFSYTKKQLISVTWDLRDVITHRAEDFGSFRSELLGAKGVQLCCLEAKLALDDILGELVLPDYDVVLDVTAQCIILAKEDLYAREKKRVLLNCEVKAIAFAVYQVLSTRGWAESKLNYARRIL